MTDLSERQTADLQRFLSELYRWNERVNLTAVAPGEAWERHIVESRNLLEFLRPRPGAAILDIGSGEGIPGLVFAVLRRDLRLFLLESRARKAGFLTHICGLLGLENAVVLNARAEALATDAQWQERFPYVISRAAAPPPRLMEWALPLLQREGMLALLVGNAEQALAQCQALVPAPLLHPETAGDGILLFTKAAE